MEDGSPRSLLAMVLDPAGLCWQQAECSKFQFPSESGSERGLGDGENDDDDENVEENENDTYGTDVFISDDADRAGVAELDEEQGRVRAEELDERDVEMTTTTAHIAVVREHEQCFLRGDSAHNAQQLDETAMATHSAVAATNGVFIPQLIPTAPSTDLRRNAGGPPSMNHRPSSLEPTHIGAVPGSALPPRKQDHFANLSDESDSFPLNTNTTLVPTTRPDQPPHHHLHHSSTQSAFHSSRAWQSMVQLPQQHHHHPQQQQQQISSRGSAFAAGGVGSAARAPLPLIVAHGGRALGESDADFGFEDMRELDKQQWRHSRHPHHQHHQQRHQPQEPQPRAAHMRLPDMPPPP